ncbi:hypothetical protein A5661_23400 [Mycobacterium asiaticum]|nr:hypothetical protein A5661_23400 [Mycobacterium asiaticum]
MLLIACLCAVCLSTPAAIKAAIGNGARGGILIKGGSHFERAGQIDVIVFGKTGTPTAGRPEVTNIVALHQDWDPAQVLGYAASSEIHSRRPARRSGDSLDPRTTIHGGPISKRPNFRPHEQCEMLVDLGMHAWADGRILLLGSQSLLLSEKVRVTEKAPSGLTSYAHRSRCRCYWPRPACLSARSACATKSGQRILRC